MLALRRHHDLSVSLQLQTGKPTQMSLIKTESLFVHITVDAKKTQELKRGHQGLISLLSLGFILGQALSYHT